jgi:pimeloyl-ACP methyl ester carboxylesterase
MKCLLLLFLAMLPSCALLPRATPVPVRILPGGKPDGDELVVFLPGRWSRVEEFEREEFFKIAGQRWPDARLVAADLHLGYFKNRSMARRLHEDVVLPARRDGVRKLRIVGISMGGLGALIYDVEYPGSANELILLSPFLGEEDALREIEAAGELAKWSPGPVAESDFTRKLWLNLRKNQCEREVHPRILLGCGKDDRLAGSNHLFAREFLKSDEQRWIAGGHDWPTWRTLLEELIRK